MAVLSAGHLHYRCTFDLRPSNDPPASWNALAEAIRSWIGNKVPKDPEFLEPWFLSGGDWQPPKKPRVSVSVRSHGRDHDSDAPQFWSVRFEHPCGETPLRQWRTDIGITALGESRFRLSLANAHRLFPEFIGPEPSVPLPSAPKIIGATIGSPDWTAHAGTEMLRAEWVDQVPGQGDAFVKRVRDPKRRCPIILVTQTRETHKCLVDYERLAGLLAGTATIYVATSPDVGEELEWLLPHSLRCVDGTVRVYYPDVDETSEDDLRRHRYLPASLILANGAAAIEGMLIRALARRSQTYLRHALTSLEDLQVKHREARLAELRKTADDSSKDEWIGLLEQETDRLQTENSRLVDELAQLRNELELAEANQDEATVDFQEKKSLFLLQTKRANAAEERVRELGVQLEGLASLSRIPESLTEVIKIMTKLHSGRLVFTESAEISARRAKIHGDRTGVAVAWKYLWAMATILHDLYFHPEERVANIEVAFKDRTGIDLTLRESESTRNDARLMRARTTMFEGKTIDIEPHLKWDGTSKRYLRIYYHAHQGQRLIVVGHCGDHKQTAGSRRRKQR